MDQVKQEQVFNLDGNTQLEFLSRKETIVIDKERFLACKQLMLENADDKQFAECLNIPVEKVRYFKYKMQLFEDSIRVRHRAKKLEKQRKKERSNKTRKREISAEERFRQARELISRNMSTSQISKILKISERSVTRFKLKMREEKKRLKAEGKLISDPNDSDDENSFKHLRPDQKLQAAKDLFKKRHTVTEIAEILKISDRTVRRYKDKIYKMNNGGAREETKKIKTEDWISEDDDIDEDVVNYEAVKRTTRSNARSVKQTIKEEEEEINIKDEEEDDNEDQYVELKEEMEESGSKRKRLVIDKEKVDYAKELMQNQLSNKEMSMLLQLSTSNFRKLKNKILDGTVNELIDNSEEHYKKIRKTKIADPDVDPLHLMEVLHPRTVPSISSQSFVIEKKPKKTVLTDRQVFIARLLDENNVRTMDIAKLMKISERSVTRLKQRAKSLTDCEYEDDVVDEVQKLLAEKDQILNAVPPTIQDKPKTPEPREGDEAKRKIGSNLLAMKVKIKDIAIMLDVSEKTVQRWKARMLQEPIEDDEDFEEDSHTVSSNIAPNKIKKEDEEHILFEEIDI